MREVRREMCEHARGTARKSERIGGTPPPTEHAEGEETPPALSLPCDSAERRPMGKQQPPHWEATNTTDARRDASSEEREEAKGGGRERRKERGAEGEERGERSAASAAR